MSELGNVVDVDGIERYRAASGRRGLTKAGVRYWVLNRIGAKGHFMFGGGGPLPEVDVGDADVGLPEGWVAP